MKVTSATLTTSDDVVTTITRKQGYLDANKVIKRLSIKVILYIDLIELREASSDLYSVTTQSQKPGFLKWVINHKLTLLLSLSDTRYLAECFILPKHYNQLFLTSDLRVLSN